MNWPNRYTPSTIIIATAILLFPLLGIAEEWMTIEDADKRAFADADLVEETLFLLTDETRTQIWKSGGEEPVSSIVEYRVAIKDDEIIGYAATRIVPGKSHPFKIYVSLNADLTVNTVEILSYSSPKGREVRKISFLSQFLGKSVNDPLKLGEDIDGISGASFSSRSVAYGTREILILLGIIVG